jgi:hypothetical protein
VRPVEPERFEIVAGSRRYRAARIVDRKIALPDLRIEYETPEGDLDHVDLELATEHCHRGHMALKTRAGFKMYGFVSTSRGRRAQWEGHELTATVLSL